MEDKAAFLKKLEEELSKIHIRPIEEFEEDIDTLSEHEESESFLEQNPNLDCEETIASAVENPRLTCTDLEDDEDTVLVSKAEALSLSKAAERECAVAPSALDKDGNGTPTRVEDASKRRRISKSVVDSKEANGSPPAKIPKIVDTGFDAEESFLGQDSDFCPEDGSKAAAEEGEDSGEGKEALEEDLPSENEFEDECKEELMALLLPEEKKELELLSNVSQLYSKLIEARVDDLNSRIRKEIEAHCSTIKQKAVEEVTVFKRSSLVVADEYQRAVLVAMKYLEVLLKRVSTYQAAALKWVVDEFRKTERKIFDKVRERKQMYREGRVYRTKTPLILHPIVFCFTLVMVLTIYASIIIRLQKLKDETS